MASKRAPPPGAADQAAPLSLGTDTQEVTLREMGFGVKNTFVEPIAEPAFGEPCSRRAKSDPTSSRSSSEDDSSALRRRQQRHQLEQLSQASGSAQQPAAAPARAAAAARAQSRGHEHTRADLFSRIIGRLSQDPALRDAAGLRRRAAAQGLDLGEVVAQVPLDDEGRMTSLGSAGHRGGKCQPCAFSDVVGSPPAAGVGAAAECMEGILCRYCHFPHASRPKVRVRPCKGRRERFRKLLSDLRPAIEEHPERFDSHFNIDACELIPHWIKTHALLKEKLKSWIIGYAAKCPCTGEERDRMLRGSLLQDAGEQLDALEEEAHFVNLGAGLTSSAAGSHGSSWTLPPGVPVVNYMDHATGVEKLCFSL